MTNNQEKDRLFSILSINHFIEATRDSGYKGTGSAVSELVDNAIQADACKIIINVEKKDSNPDISISVLDNGCGMDPFTLRYALQFGGSSRFNDRKGIGRYGMGLPNSSFSQAKKLHVYSWQHAAGRNSSKKHVYATQIYIEDIANGKISTIPKPVLVRNPPKQCSGKSGTLIVWSECDRLDNSRVSTIVRKLKNELGQRFRYFISAGVRIVINNEEVEIVDPLFLNPLAIHHGAKQYGKELVYEVSTDISNPDATTDFIYVRFSELPVKRWRDLSNDEKRDRGISKGAGVYILRAGREVDSGWFFMGGKRKENYDDWWRCEIEFPPTLDEVFGITHTKQQVRPSEHLATILTSDLENIARTLNKRARDAHRVATKNNNPKKQSEIIADRRESLFSPLTISASSSAQKKMQQFRKKKLVESNRKTVFEYRIVSTKAGSTCLYSYGFSNNSFALGLNQSHPFFREFSKFAYFAPKDYMKLSTLIELLILSAARSEADERKPDKRKVIENFRKRWSDILATYINN